MKLSEIIKDIEIIEMTASPDTEISGISYDSRKAESGHIFVAIRGLSSDGHKYIDYAIKNGAAVIICEEKPSSAVPYVLVRDSRLALALASRTWFDYPAKDMTIIGVTGTNGKTTTTYLLKHLLEDRLKAKVGLVGTNGNMIGELFLHTERTTPESYELQELFSEMRKAGCTHVVMEVSSHSLVLERVAGIDFEVGIFTNLTQDHLDFHKTMDEYALAKSKLFNMCRYGCINIDDPWSGTVLSGADCTPVRYSLGEGEAELCARDIELSPNGIAFEAVTPIGSERVTLGIPGRFSVYNALGVIAAGMCLGLSLNSCAVSLASAQGVKGRMELCPTDGDYSIIIDYAHTPDALENALKALKKEGHRLVVLFGCGGDRDRTKRPLMGDIAARYADHVIVTSDNPRTEEPLSIISEIVSGIKSENFEVIPDRTEAIRSTIDNHMPKDIILLAGKGHEDYQVIGMEKIHLDEREVVRDYIDKRNGK